MLDKDYIHRIKKRSILHFTIGLFPRFINFSKNTLIVLFARIKGAEVHFSSSIPFKLALKANKNLIVGVNSVIESNRFDLREKIVIGNKVIINKDVVIIRQSHDLDSLTFKTTGRPLIIEDYSWITTGVIISPSCTKIGTGAVVAVGSVVVKDVEERHIVGGNPSNFIKIRLVIPSELEFDSFQGRDFLKYLKARFVK